MSDIKSIESSKSSISGTESKNGFSKIKNGFSKIKNGFSKIKMENERLLIDETSTYVIKRDGRRELVNPGKVTRRINAFCSDLDPVLINAEQIACDVIENIVDNISTTELDELTAKYCAERNTTHPDFKKLASRIIVSNLHKNTEVKFTDVVRIIRDNAELCEQNVLSDSFYQLVMKYGDKFNGMLRFERDERFDYFGFKTMEKAYLLRTLDPEDPTNPQKKTIVERPQHMLLRVAIEIHQNDLKRVKETYNLMSEGYMIHATPTLFNSGTWRAQLSSCFLFGIPDSVKGMYRKTAGDLADISKLAGGIGLNAQQVRPKNSVIKGTNGVSDGVLAYLCVLGKISRHINQSGRRKGSFAVYTEPWTADIFEFLEAKLPTGKEEARARDLFYAMWIPDEFMRRVRADQPWSLMSPVGKTWLHDTYGEKWEKKYAAAEAAGDYIKQVPARKIWNAICKSQKETGMPYMVYKDIVNRRTNQKNLGTIRNSNLCAEITEYNDDDEYATCNLGSLGLGKFVEYKRDLSTGTSTPWVNYDKLHEVAKVMGRNLDLVIDRNYYPVPETRVSNLKHRPIGMGVQGLADVFCKMRIPYDSAKALDVNNKIFETIYHAAMEVSCEIAQEKGPYSTFEGSPASKGILQFDMWDTKPYTDRYDWDKLKTNIRIHGLRNSLSVALMPTASTSQILGYNECFEPFTSNIYRRTTLAGHFVVINKYLIQDLIDSDLWSVDMKDKLIACEGSVQDIAEIPNDIKQLYKTVWEIDQRALITLSLGRGPYVCQSQSMNIFIPNPTIKQLTQLHFFGWNEGKGVKTGSYYTRSKPAASAQKFTIDPNLLKQLEDDKLINDKLSAEEKYIQDQLNKDPNVCSLENPEGCIACSG
jgi:ribonucleoside-diphosphate reductase alpha chain